MMGQLQNFMHNPDLTSAQSSGESKAQDTPKGWEGDLDMIPEDSENKSKTLGTDMLKINLSAPMKSVEKGEGQMQLAPHEILFFQYLSILAMLPNKW